MKADINKQIKEILDSIVQLIGIMKSPDLLSDKNKSLDKSLIETLSNLKHKMELKNKYFKEYNKGPDILKKFFQNGYLNITKNINYIINLIILSHKITDVDLKNVIDIMERDLVIEINFLLLNEKTIN